MARRLLWVTVLGSGMAFLDASIVNVALPSIGSTFGVGTPGMQWVLNAYLVPFTALLLVGGVLGDRHGHRTVFGVGVRGFAAATVIAALSPNIAVLVAARAAQGVAAALLVPTSLALLTGSTPPDDRSRAVGAWSGLTAVAGVIGPLVGGWLIDAASWRWALLLTVPPAVAVSVMAPGLPRARRADASPPLDVPGAVTAAGALALLTAGLIGHGSRWSWPVVVAGALAAVAFVVVERRSPHPMLPLDLFASRQFSGANLVTLAVYTGLGASTFLVVVALQVSLRYSATEAGAAMLPVTLLLMVLSSRAGRLAQRIGPTLPMTVGALGVGAGLALLAQVEPGSRYATSVLPGVVVLGLGLAATVAPLTAVVLASVDDERLGLGSGVNNAVARLAGLVGVAVLPAVTSVDVSVPVGRALPGFRATLMIAAGLCAAGAAVAAATIRHVAPVEPTVGPAAEQPCLGPSRMTDTPSAGSQADAGA